MARYGHILNKLLLPLAAVMLTACYDVENDREICDYKVKLRYDYNEENTNRQNVIEYYVHSIDEYIFDNEGILFCYRTVTSDRCTEHLDSELDLPPGRYSVIAIGNRDERSVAWDAEVTGMDAPTVGQTRRNDMMLTLRNCTLLANDTYGPSERLYHGYKTFTVNDRGISRIRVDMVNAHFSLKFRVTWKNGATPSRDGEYYALLQAVPSEYNLMPEYIYPIGSFRCKEHQCDSDDGYPSDCSNVIHHIPATCYGNNNGRTHRYDTRMNADNEMWGQFISYRLKSDVKPKLRLFKSRGTKASEDEQIVRDIDLQTYFDWYEHNLDTKLKQEYEIDIIIDGEKIIMMPLNVADWDEGGILN